MGYIVIILIAYIAFLELRMLKARRIILASSKAMNILYAVARHTKEGKRVALNYIEALDNLNVRDYMLVTKNMCRSYRLPYRTLDESGELPEDLKLALAKSMEQELKALEPSTRKI